MDTTISSKDAILGAATALEGKWSPAWIEALRRAAIVDELRPLMVEVIDEAADESAERDDEFQLSDTPLARQFAQGAEEYRYGKGNAELTANNGTIFTKRSVLLDYCAHLLEQPSTVRDSR